MSLLRCPKCGSSRGFTIQTEDWRCVYVDGDNQLELAGPGGIKATVICETCSEHIKGRRQQAPFIEAALAHRGKF